MVIIHGCDCTETASTTGTKYGVYGLAGGRPEIVAAGLNIAGVFNLSDYNTSTKYATSYGIVNGKTTVYGDAVLDSEVADWGAERVMPSEVYPIFTRGGNMGGGNIFAYSQTDTINNSTCTFRPVIIIEY